jgi:YfiH family protein
MMQRVLQSGLLLRAGFSHGFSLRQGGVSLEPYASLNLGRVVGDDPAHVLENHRRMAEAVGYPHERVFELSQVHGRRVREVFAAESPAAVRQEEGDALLARERGVAIGVRAADCLPLLLVDPESRAVAAVHAGWRGTVLGVAVAAVQALRELAGAPASRLQAAVFPHIRACCFEVGDEVAEEIVRATPDRQANVVDRTRERPHVALAAVIRAQLLAAGLVADNLDDVAGCTRCDAERFFSYRRDGKRSGRHLLAVVSGD